MKTATIRTILRTTRTALAMTAMLASAIAMPALILILAQAPPARAAQQIGLNTFTVVIANGTSLSAEVDLGANSLVGIAMPSTWTAADLTFQVSADGGTTWLELQTTAAAVDFKAAASQFVAVDPTALRGFNALKVRSGTLASAVNQGADRTLILVGRAF